MQQGARSNIPYQPAMHAGPVPALGGPLERMPPRFCHDLSPLSACVCMGAGEIAPGCRLS